MRLFLYCMTALTVLFGHSFLVSEEVESDPALAMRHRCRPDYAKTATLESPNLLLNPIGGNDYGNSVAFNGRYLFIADKSAVSDSSLSSGAVYVYYYNDSNQWEFTQALTTGGNEDNVGNLSVKSEGKFLFISAIGTPLNEEDPLAKDYTGALLVYHRSHKKVPGTEAHRWELVQVIDRHTPGLEGLTAFSFEHLNSGALFGLQHAVDLEKGWLLVAAPFQVVNDPVTHEAIDNAGAVYAFRRNSLSGLWELHQTLINPENLSLLLFGGNLAVNNGYALISNSLVGSVPAISPFISRNGTVYVFHLSEKKQHWHYFQKLKGDESMDLAQQVEFGDSFGGSLSIDGKWALIGAPLESFSDSLEERFQGAAYFFHLLNDKWHRAQKIVSDDVNTPFKRTSYFTADIKGHMAIISDSSRTGPAGEQQGGILVYHRRHGSWKPYPIIFDPNGAAFENFGASAALSSIRLINGRPKIFFAGGISNFTLPSIQPKSVSIFEGICQ